jgi:RNA polymerase sigma-70 factor (ECF subfamily)
VRAVSLSVHSDVDDATLMVRMGHGERRALAALYERHGGVALSLARRMLGSPEAAEDAVQDSFVALWRRASTFRPGAASPRTWLLTIVRNRCIDVLRRGDAHVNRNVSLEDAQPQAIDSDPWPELWKQHCGEAVRSALAMLPPEQRTVIELGFYGGFSHAQIAERLDAPLGTVKKRMRTGLKRMRAALDERFAEAAS